MGFGLHAMNHVEFLDWNLSKNWNSLTLWRASFTMVKIWKLKTTKTESLTGFWWFEFSKDHCGFDLNPNPQSFVWTAGVKRERNRKRDKSWNKKWRCKSRSGYWTGSKAESSKRKWVLIGHWFLSFRPIRPRGINSWKIVWPPYGGILSSKYGRSWSILKLPNWEPTVSTWVFVWPETSGHQDTGQIESKISPSQFGLHPFPQFQR